jgi:hypothetical protein
MSLIDDALKRAEAAGPASTGRAPAWTPTHLPERQTSSMRFAAPLVIGLIALAGVAWVLTRRSAPVSRPVSHAAAKAPLEEVPPIVSAAESGRIEGPDVIVPPPVMPPAAARSHPPAEHAAARPRPDESKIPSESAPEPHPAISGPLPAPHPSKALANGKTYTGEVSLANGARIELDGIVFSESNPVALLNGHVVAPGGYVEGMTLSKVEPDRVELQGQGITVTLLLR